MLSLLWGKILPHTILLPCVVGYYERKKLRQVVKLSITGIKKSSSSSDKIADWYVFQFLKYAVLSLLDLKVSELNKEFLFVIKNLPDNKIIVNSEAKSLVALSQIFYREKCLDKALFFVSSAVEKSPDNAWYQYLCGWCNVASGEVNESKKFFRKSIELDNNFIEKLQQDALLKRHDNLVDEILKK